MSLTLELSSVEERQLQGAADHRGVRAEELAHQLVSQITMTAFQVETGRATREEMTEERRDWERVTPGD
jgi:hypothetical protein